MTLDERLQALTRELERFPAHDQQQPADQIEQWLEDIGLLDKPSPDALYDAACEATRQGRAQPLRLEDFAEEA